MDGWIESIDMVHPDQLMFNSSATNTFVVMDSIFSIDDAAKKLLTPKAQILLINSSVNQNF